MWAYPSTGRPLYLSTYSGGTKTSQLTFPVNPIIATNALSDSEPISDAIKVTLNITYDGAPGAATTIEFDNEPTFSSPITLTTIPAGADVVAALTITEPYNGFIRVSNTSTEQINSVVVNKQISSVY